MHEEHLIRKVKMLVEGYDFSQPFANYLKDHFRNNPQMGARDRRQTREWSFNYFRIGRNLKEQTFEKRLGTANYLCSSQAYPSLSYLLKTHSAFDESDLGKSVEEKIEIVKKVFPEFSLENIFDAAKLSPEISKDDWQISFLKKPKVWIRVRRQFLKNVLDELNANQIAFEKDENPLTLSFLPDVALEKTESWKSGYFEIQDKSSQRTGEYFQPRDNENWWDACAGSGGKSLMLLDENSSIRLFATDIREHIIKTFNERMVKVGHGNFQSEKIDLSKGGLKSSSSMFDGVIADVPCTGSGTWSRSPEWLLKDSMQDFISKYSKLQKSIVSNILPSLKAGFPLIFITCSVFREENEENTSYFQERFPLRLEKSAYLQGNGSGCDTLYVARFIKNF